MKKETAIFGMGCFWGPQYLFDKIPGIIRTEVGYMGGQGKKDFYSYKEVCGGKTGHAEVIKVEFDSSKMSYEKLLEVFWENHNPTTLNRQGLDFGEQYRSVIFYFNDSQKSKAENSKRKAQKNYRNKIVTGIVKVGKFYRAEEYHQKYIEKTGKNVC
jgi:peptide-methionine (S)-S-oxide reductase